MFFQVIQSLIFLTRKLTNLLPEKPFINFYTITKWAAIVAIVAFLVGFLIIYAITEKEKITTRPHAVRASDTTKFLAFVAIVGCFSLAVFALYQIMLSEGLDSNEFSVGLQVYVDGLLALFAFVCIYRYNRSGILIGAVMAACCFVLLVILVYAGGLDLEYSNRNDWNVGLLNTHIVMLAANVILGLAAMHTTLLVSFYEDQHPNKSASNYQSGNSSSRSSVEYLQRMNETKHAQEQRTSPVAAEDLDRKKSSQDSEWLKEVLKELAAEKQAQEAQAKAKEPAAPKAENKYTIYSSDEVPLIAKRVLDDMPSDIFGIELLTLKQNMLKKIIAEKDDFNPGDDLRFYMYKAFYSHTYDLLLNDQCYFMGDFTPIGRDIYRLCTYCLDESHRLGYVDDVLYKAQKNNISINVRNGKSFS